MANLEKGNPYRTALIALIHSINNQVPLDEEERLLIMLKLNSEKKIIKFNKWIKNRVIEDDLHATAAEIARAAVKIGKEE